MMDMLDVKYIKETLPASQISKEIDDSWREVLYLYKITRKSLPCQPNPFQPMTIMMGIGNECAYILVGERTISIEKMLYGRKMFCIKEPLIFNTKIWAKITTDDRLESLHMNPAWGFHFLGITNTKEIDYPPICLGDMKLPKNNSLKDISLFVDEVVKMLQIVNLRSVGAIYLPSDSPLKKGVDNNGGIGIIPDYFSGLLAEKIVTPFLEESPPTQERLGFQMRKEIDNG